MSFLAPLFLGGLAALAVPVLLHLTRSERTRPLPFPSLMFLERIPFRETRRRRIRNWFLLLLRLAALALLVAAFARPFLPRADVLGATGEGPIERVIVLDRSYSLLYEDRWSDAVAAARSALEPLGIRDRASLVTFARTPTLHHRSSPEVSRLLSTLDTLGVSDEATRFGPALKLAEGILAASTLPRRSLVLISDFQQTGWDPDEDVSLPPATELTPVDLSGPGRGNRTVADVGLQRARVGGRDRVTATARILNRSGGPAMGVDVVLELDGQELQRRTVDVDSAAAAAVTFEPFTLSPPFARGRIRLGDDDALSADDQIHFVLSPNRAVRVLILDGPGAQSTNSLYLREALGISDDGAFDATRRGSVSFGADDAARFDVVILNDAPFPPGASGAALQAFVESGGGLLVVSGSRSTWPGDQQGLLPGSLGGVRDVPRDEELRMAWVDHDHPVFEIFQGERSGDFSVARFFRARGFTPSDSATVIARFDDGTVALAERRVGQGSVLFWASGLDRLWNDLALQPIYLPFVHRVVTHLSGRAALPAWWRAGDVVDLTPALARPPAGWGEEPELVALTPRGGTVPVDPGAPFQVVESGLYEIRPPGSARPGESVPLAVNVDPEEGSLRPVDLEEFVAAVGSAPATVSATPGAGEADRIAEEDLERAQGVWRYLLLGTFLLLLSETVLSNGLSRHALRRTEGGEGR